MSAAKPPVAIIMGSRSDWPTMKCAADALDSLGVANRKRGRSKYGVKRAKKA